MIQEIITKIEQSIQCVLCYLLNLCFQPIYCVLQIVQGIIDIWDDDTAEEQPEEQHSVNLYQSANEGKCGAEDDCDDDITCDPYSKKIGYRINH